jgi:hypothetical protein
MAEGMAKMNRPIGLMFLHHDSAGGGGNRDQSKTHGLAHHKKGGAEIALDKDEIAWP